ncbi:MAG: hypothetical protein K0S12_2329, partial [Bacteroidetes bacterium]|nr:hypothetical protein [Bacteroidota bacterium]
MKGQGAFILIFFILLRGSVFSQYVIKGKIFAASNKEALPFVPVMIKGTTIGAQSDFDGNFVIKTSKLGDSLIATYVGYKRTARAIKKGLTEQEVNIPMEDVGGVSLDEVTVLAGDNPAHRIVRNCIRKKEVNNRNNLESFEYETYNKLEFDLNRIPKEMREKKILKAVAFIFDNVDSLNSGEKHSLPFFIVENL